jgi:hypothetical protein
MNRTIAIAGILVLCFAGVPSLCLAGSGSDAAQSDSDPSTTPAKAPSAFLPVTQWEFEPVVDGASVVHDFVIRNKGDAPLNISRVKTG